MTAREIIELREAGNYRQRQPVPPEIRYLILLRDDYTCCRCGHRGRPGLGPGKVSVHHVVPFSLGGSHDGENLETLCTTCHHAADSECLRAGLWWGRYQRGEVSRDEMMCYLSFPAGTPRKRIFREADLAQVERRPVGRPRKETER